jgi:hypothetical protein
MSLQPLPQLAPQAQRAPLPFKEPPKPLNLAPPPKPALDLAPAPKPALDLAPAPKPALNLSPAPNVAVGAGAVAGASTGTGASLAGAAALAGPAAVIVAAGLTLAILPDPSPEEQQANFDALPDSLKKDYCSLNPGDPVCSGAPAVPDESDVTGGAIPEEVWAEGDPPFTGGQEEGVLYLAQGTRTVTRKRCSNDSIVSEGTADLSGGLYGPIGGPQVTEAKTACGGTKTQSYLETYSGYTSSGSANTLALGLSAPLGEYLENPKINLTWVRADGQPDTGGDPDPVLVPTPATSPQRRAIAGDPLSKLANPPEVDPIYLPTPIELPEPLNLQPKGAPIVDLPKAADPQPASLPNGEVASDAAADADPNTTTEPGVTPDGYPTGKEAPKANSQNVPNNVQIPGLALGNQIGEALPEDPYSTSTDPFPTLFPPLIQPKTQEVSKLKNPTKPGETTEPIAPPPPPPSEQPRGGCGCNPPIIAGQKQLGDKLDELKDFLANNGLDATILEELLRMSNRMGTNAFPMSAPANLAKPGTSTRTLENLAETQLWQVEQLDGLLGQFPNKLEIEHPDGSTIDMDTPNVSEALAEILGMLVGLTVNSSQILHTSSRALHQAGSATQQAFRAAQYAKGNADYLGYKSVESAFPLPLSYSPGKDPFDGFLQESSKTVQNFENVDKDDFRKQLMELLQAAAIIRAVYWRKLSAQEDFGQQIQTLITEQSGFIDARAKDSRNDGDWEAYLKRVEDGFTTGAGGTGSDTPYGRDRSETPNIRDLSLGGD